MQLYLKTGSLSCVTLGINQSSLSVSGKCSSDVCLSVLLVCHSSSSGTLPLEMKVRCNIVYQDCVPAYDKNLEKFTFVLPT